MVVIFFREKHTLALHTPPYTMEIKAEDVVPLMFNETHYTETLLGDEEFVAALRRFAPDDLLDADIPAIRLRLSDIRRVSRHVEVRHEIRMDLRPLTVALAIKEAVDAYSIARILQACKENAAEHQADSVSWPGVIASVHVLGSDGGAVEDGDDGGFKFIVPKDVYSAADPGATPLYTRFLIATVIATICDRDGYSCSIATIRKRRAGAFIVGSYIGCSVLSYMVHDTIIRCTHNPWFACLFNVMKAVCGGGADGVKEMRLLEQDLALALDKRRDVAGSGRASVLRTAMDEVGTDQMSLIFSTMNNELWKHLSWADMLASLHMTGFSYQCLLSGLPLLSYMYDSALEALLADALDLRLESHRTSMKSELFVRIKQEVDDDDDLAEMLDTKRHVSMLDGPDPFMEQPVVDALNRFAARSVCVDRDNRKRRIDHIDADDVIYEETHTLWGRQWTLHKMSVDALDADRLEQTVREHKAMFGL